jgi:hypothetical protein
MIPLYMDENVRGAITRGLRARSVDVLTAQEDGYDGVLDPLVLDRATELERLLFTNDDDMLSLAVARYRAGTWFFGVIYAEQDGPTIGQCVTDLELIHYAGRREEFVNLIRYLPLRW